MKNFLVLFIISSLSSCVYSVRDCDPLSNGFIDGVNGEVTMGSESALEVFNKMDKAWAELNYDILKTFIANDAEMKFANGKIATGPEEFIDHIKDWVNQVENEDGNEYKWNTDYAFSLAVTSIDGDWVNAQFTSTHTNPESMLEAEVYYEFYHIVDGKVKEWSQFKRDVLR